ncbi:MAG: hypothetical protein A4E62_02677 [Syntrophorhabdus sp. PtaU1.Bin002]|nr:MAG: hypothetical protein A4E62_02677 [Syntrophorhabdus sp. PtaU1.Bin002]
MTSRIGFLVKKNVEKPNFILSKGLTSPPPPAKPSEPPPLAREWARSAHVPLHAGAHVAPSTGKAVGSHPLSPAKARWIPTGDMNLQRTLGVSPWESTLQILTPNLRLSGLYKDDRNPAPISNDPLQITLFDGCFDLVHNLLAAQGANTLQEAIFGVKVDKRSGLFIIGFKTLRDRFYSLVGTLHCRGAALYTFSIRCGGFAFNIVNLLAVGV